MQAPLIQLLGTPLKSIAFLSISSGTIDGKLVSFHLVSSAVFPSTQNYSLQADYLPHQIQKAVLSPIRTIHALGITGGA